MLLSPGCLYQSDLGFLILDLKYLCFSEVVNSLLTAHSVGTALLAEGGRKLFLKKTDAGGNLTELRLVWSERRAFGFLQGLESQVELVTQLVHVICAEL